MAFWSKKPSSQQSRVENPYRELDPVAFDKGARINDLAGQLRGMVSKLERSDAVLALQTALGAEIAAMTARRNPNAGPDTLRYFMNQLPARMPEGLREAAYIEADLPPPQHYGDRDLTEEEFRELTERIINAATQGNVPATESMTATAKALGIILCIVGERPGADIDKLVAFSQEAIGQFAKEAVAFQKNR
jgi:hypothetical protein